MMTTTALITGRPLRSALRTFSAFLPSHNSCRVKPVLRSIAGRHYSFLAQSHRWKELVVNEEDFLAQKPITTIVVPLTTREWDSLMENLADPDLKQWLQDQTGVIRLLPDMADEIGEELNLHDSKLLVKYLQFSGFGSSPTQVQRMLVRLDKEVDPTHSTFGNCQLKPASKSMPSLCKITAPEHEPCILILPPGSEWENHTDELLKSHFLSSYSFDRYKSTTPSAPPLKIAYPYPDMELSALVSAIFWCQDLISTPARDLSPATLQKAAQEWADTQPVTMESIVGTDLLSYNGSLPTTFGCGMIHAVGQAAHAEERLPRLIRIKYEPSKKSRKDKSVALVGKGVTFDTGGLNLKPGDSMLTMKKDMGGAAHALALFRLLVETKYSLPVELFLPVAENVIGANSFRPGDILTAVNGKTTEIGNTDAEGRLILGDALALASAENPSILIDFATLTGAARSALGTEVPALFTNQCGLEMEAVLKAAEVTRDPMWPLPLWEGYRGRMKGKIADFGNIASDNGLGGAITAALYLSEFVGKQISWYHLDLHGLDKEGQGRAQSLHAMYNFLKTYEARVPNDEAT
jgi:leucyl aminopeptidase